MEKRIPLPQAVVILALIFIAFVAGYYYGAGSNHANRASDPGSTSPSLHLDGDEQNPQDAAGPEIFAPHFGLYTGQGCDLELMEAVFNFLDEYAISYSEFDQQDVVNKNLSDAYDAVWFAGGFSEEYRLYIKDHSNIAQFVEAGNLFIGTCAGAYYAADTMVWMKTAIDYPLKLFAGQAVGPHMNFGEAAALALNQDLAVNDGFPPTIGMRYFQGPYFIPAETQEVTVLAEYEYLRAPAVLSFDYGRGKVLLMGPHPELGYDPEKKLLNTRGGDGAQWPWLYAVLKWLLNSS